MSRFKKLEELKEQRRMIEAETPGAEVQDLEAWQQRRRQLLQDIDAQLSDLRNEAARNVGEFEKR